MNRYRLTSATLHTRHLNRAGLCRLADLALALAYVREALTRKQLDALSAVSSEYNDRVMQSEKEELQERGSCMPL